MSLHARNIACKQGATGTSSTKSAQQMVKEHKVRVTEPKKVLNNSTTHKATNNARLAHWTQSRRVSLALTLLFSFCFNINPQRIYFSELGAVTVIFL
jgi:hypothetical protein